MTPNDSVTTAMDRVIQVWPDAHVMRFDKGACIVPWKHGDYHNRVSSWFDGDNEAWLDAASRLPSSLPEPSKEVHKFQDTLTKCSKEVESWPEAIRDAAKALMFPPVIAGEIPPIDTGSELDHIGKKCLLERDTWRKVNETSEDFAHRLRLMVVAERTALATCQAERKQARKLLADANGFLAAGGITYTEWRAVCDGKETAEDALTEANATISELRKEWTPIKLHPKAYKKVEVVCVDTPWQSAQGIEWNFLRPIKWRYVIAELKKESQ